MSQIDAAAAATSGRPPSDPSGTTVFLFGDALAAHVDLRLQRGLSIVSRVEGISPLSVCAPADELGLDARDLGRSARIDAGKELDEAFARADADYLVVDLSAAGRPLARSGRTVLTGDERLRRLASEAVGDDSGHEILVPTDAAVREELLANFDRFVECVLRHFRADRIILLESHHSDYILADGHVRLRPSDASTAPEVTEFLSELDARFEQATGCHRVDAARRSLPILGDAEEVRVGEDLALALERVITGICQGSRPVRPVKLRQRLFSRPSKRPFTEWASSTLSASGEISPSEVARRLLGEGQVVSIADLVAVAALVDAAPAADWSELSRGILDSPRCEGVVETRRRYTENVRVLTEYEHNYIDAGYPKRVTRVVLPLVDSWYLDIHPESPSPITVRRYGRSAEFDVKRFIAAKYSCEVSQIENALENWRVYFARGRRRHTEVPFRLSFDTVDEFFESMHFLDYEDLLVNERYCLTIRGVLPAGIEWAPRVDTNFLFDSRTRVCCIRSGLGDQLYYYVYAREIADELGLNLYIDDLLYDDDDMIQSTPHVRPDVLSMVRTSGVFSEMFSPRLRRARRRDNTHRRENRSEYYDFGLREQVIAAGQMHVKCWVKYQDLPRSLAVQVMDLDGMKRLTANPPGVLFLDVLAKGQLTSHRLLAKKPSWEGAITPPALQSARSEKIAELMMSTDAVVVHVRRGDRAALGMADGDEYYRDFVRRAAALEGYGNKHWFVFSDDLEYCRERRSELGLDLAGDSITFVEGNHHFASTDDLHLMSLGKIIVCGRSGFSASAAMLSTRVEHIFGSGYSLTRGGDSWHREQPAPVG